MAYMNQEKKKTIDEAVKAICAKYGVKYTLAVRHHSTIVMTIKSAPLDFLADAVECRWNAEALQEHRQPTTVNPYCWREHFKGNALEFLRAIFSALNDGNWDKSDIQSDYFNVGWYVDLRLGTSEKPYQITH